MWYTEIIATCFATFVGAFSGWYFSRKKEKVEIQGTEIDNAKELIEIYRGLTLEFKAEFEKGQKILKQQQEIINHFEKQCSHLNKCKLSQ